MHACACDPSWGFDELHGDATALPVDTRKAPHVPEAGVHPNLIDRVDHVVYAVPDLDPAVDALTAVARRGTEAPGVPAWTVRTGDGVLHRG